MAYALVAGDSRGGNKVNPPRPKRAKVLSSAKESPSPSPTFERQTRSTSEYNIMGQ